MVFLVWLGLLSGCCLLIYKTMDQYLRYGIVVTMTSEDLRKTHLPAVTICPNHGGWTKSIWGGSAFFMQYQGMSGQYERPAQINRTCYDPSIPDLSPDAAAMQKLLFQSGFSVAQATQRIALIPYDKVLRKCEVKAKEVPCADLFFGRLGVTNVGLCFTFNYNGTVPTGDFSWSFKYGEESYHFNLAEVKSSGVQTGLRVRLDAREKDFCMSPQYPFQGFKVEVHSVNSLPTNLDSNGILVSPGTRTQIGVREIVTNKRNAEDLGRCDSSKKLHLFGDLPYSKANCIAECLAELIWKECRCLTFTIPGDLTAARRHFNNTVKTYHTTDLWTMNMTEFLEDTPMCYGHPEGGKCYHKTSSTKYPPTNMLPNLMAETGIATEEEFMNNIAELDVFLSTMTQERIAEDWAFPSSALFNSLGGSMGLFLGISVFSLAEMIAFLIALACNISPLSS